MYSTTRTNSISIPEFPEGVHELGRWLYMYIQIGNSCDVHYFFLSFRFAGSFGKYQKRRKFKLSTFSFEMWKMSRFGTSLHKQEEKKKSLRLDENFLLNFRKYQGIKFMCLLLYFYPKASLLFKRVFYSEIRLHIYNQNSNTWMVHYFT